MACCGKKRAAERLAHGQSQPPVKPAPLAAPASAMNARPLRSAQPAAPAYVATPRRPVPANPLTALPAQMAAPAPATELRPIDPPASLDPPTSDVEFEYTGNGRLTVTGPITGTVYYFTAGGESVTVHGSDAPSLASVPGLRMTQ